MPDWDLVFSPTLPVLEIVVRGTITFLALTAMMRLIGQRESGGLGITDVLLVVLVADAAGAGLSGDASSIGDGLLLVATILAWSVVLDAIGYRWPRLARVMKGKPKILIREGRLDRRIMRRELMTYDEVLSQLRLHGLDDPSQVGRAYLEPNGMISVLSAEGVDAEDPPPQHPAV